MAKGDSIRTLSTAQLLAEIRALDSRRTGSGTGTATSNQPPPPSILGSSQSDAARALSTHFGDGNAYRSGFNRSSDYGKDNNRGFRGRSRGGFGRGRGCGRGGFGGRNGKKK